MLPNFSIVKLAYRSLKRQKRRSILTMLAISIGISAVITIMAAGKGIRYYVLSQLDMFDPNVLAIEPKVPSTKKTSADNAMMQASGITITSMNEKDLKSILAHPNIETAYPMLTGQEPVSYGGQIKKILLWGEGASAPQMEKIDIEVGRFFTKDEEDSLSMVALLGSKSKDKLFGVEDAIGKSIYIKGKAFKVIGVFKPRGAVMFFDMDNIVVLPTKTLQKKILGVDHYLEIVAKMKDGSKLQATVEDLTEIMRENHSITDPIRDDFAVNSMAEARSILNTVMNGITLLLVALVCISLLVGGVGIMNIMYVSVAERTFEIGLRKSLGANSRHILNQFLYESMLVTLGGGVVGIILGSIFAFIIYYLAVSNGMKWVYSISLGSIFLAVGFSAGIGLLFGIYPARKAAALNPIDAIRKE